MTGGPSQIDTWDMKPTRPWIWACLSTLRWAIAFGSTAITTACKAPTNCPACTSDLEEEGAFLYCVNVECPEQMKGRIVHMASRRALDIDRLGPKYVDQLMEAGLSSYTRTTARCRATDDS